jgi:hypothetical protein
LTTVAVDQPSTSRSFAFATEIFEVQAAAADGDC